VELFVVGIGELFVVGCVHAGAGWAIVRGSGIGADALSPAPAPPRSGVRAAIRSCRGRGRSLVPHAAALDGAVPAIRIGGTCPQGPWRPGRPPLPVTSIYRQVCQFARTTGETASSYWVVRDVVGQLLKSLLTLAHQASRRTVRASTWCTASRPLLCGHHSPCGRGSGARAIRTGTSAAYRRCFTPTTDRISHRGIPNRWPPS